MEIKPYICERCGGAINVTKMRCEYCGTAYENKALERVVIESRALGQHTIKAQVSVPHHIMLGNPEAARDMALSELRHQLADGLLAFMTIRTSTDYMAGPFDEAEIIRGEVRVIDPSFSNGRW